MMEGYQHNHLTNILGSDYMVLPFPPNSKLARAFLLPKDIQPAFRQGGLGREPCSRNCLPLGLVTIEKVCKGGCFNDGKR